MRPSTRLLLSLVLGLALVCADVALGQPATLVKEFATGTNSADSSPESMTAFGSHVYFAATNGADGIELWKSDGTAAGTVMVRDINPGPSVSNPRFFAVMGSFLYFAANDGSRGDSLWRTDGTAAGTVLVKDFFPDSNSSLSVISGMLAVGPRLFITLFGVGALWVSDGTDVGTVEIGPTQVLTSMVAFNGGVVYGGILGVGGTNREPMFSNGTTAGTYRIKEVMPGTTGSYPDGFVAFGSKFCFTANDGISGEEPWVSDGTDAGTFRLADIRGGSPSSTPEILGKAGSRAFFRANDGLRGDELWSTDGTTAGTQLVKDIRTGLASASPSQLVELNGAAIFNASDGATGTELWRSDGTDIGTYLLKDIAPGASTGTLTPDSKTVIGNTLYFRARASSSPQLWKSDGTTAGTVVVFTFSSAFSGDDLGFFASANSLILFTSYASGSGQELWATNGTQAGTFLVKDIYIRYNGGNPTELADFGGILLFGASVSASSGLWRSDGSTAGTTLVTSQGAGEFTLSGGQMFFRGSGTTGTELWKTDATTAGTVLVKDIFPGTSSNSSFPLDLVDRNGTLFFSALLDVIDTRLGRELWKSDGTEAGTQLVADINSGSASSSPTEIVNANGTLFFAASELTTGTELWKTDGSGPGTILVKNIATGSTNSDPQDLTPIGSVLYFSASDDGSSRDLWKSDGTDAGTVKVTDFGSLASLTPLGTTLLFSAFSSGSGTELWKSDGTSAGTILVKDVNPGTESAEIRDLTRVGSIVYFVANDGTSGFELWKTDGTLAGTTLVRDINTGPVGSNPRNLFNAGGKLLFVASDGSTGAELWVSDGTSAGTMLLQDLNPGASGSLIDPFAGGGNRIFFGADNMTSGKELWSLPFSAICTPPSTPVITRTAGPAISCPGQSIALDAGAGYSAYLWSTGATTRTITVAPTVTTTYSVYGFNASGCPSAVRTYTQTVNPVLSGVAISLNGSASACATGTGGTLTVTDTGGGVSTHQWGFRTVSGGSTTPIVGQTGTTYVLNGNHFPAPASYFVVETTTPTCGTAQTSNEVPITINASMSSGTVTLNGSNQVCANSTAGTITVSVTGGGSLTHTWAYRTTPTGATTTIPGETGSSYVISGNHFPAPGTYYVLSIVTPSCGNPTIFDQTQIVVKAVPAVPSPSSNSPVCEGAVLNLTAPSVADATYSWTGPNGFTSTQQNPVISGVTTAAAGQYNLAVTVNGCIAQASTSVVVNPKPNAPVASNSGPVCPGGTATLMASNVTGATYAWTGPNGFVSSMQNPTIADVTSAFAGDYTVVASANGCTSTGATTTLSVNTPPVATITAPASMPAGSSNSASVPDAGAGATYQWTITNGSIVSGQGTRTLNFSAAQSVILHLDVTVSTNGSGCSSTGTADITIIPLPTITSFGPSEGTAGTLVAISGSDFVDVLFVRFGGTSSSFSVNSANSITASVPFNATTGKISVTTASGTSNSATNFVVLPRINGFNPASGPSGTVVGISGTNLLAVNAVRFNGVNASSFTIVSATSISATVPGAATTGPITVETPDGSAASSTNFTVTAVGVPPSFSATAMGISRVVLTWGAVAGAVRYEVYRSRSVNGPYELAVSTMATSLDDPLTLSPETTYLYKVRAIGASSASALSAADAATAVEFAEVLSVGVVIRAAHLVELRVAVNAMRLAAGLSPFLFTDAVIDGNTLIRRIHIVELRSALDEARAIIGLPAIARTDSVITVGMAAKAAHFGELRNETR